MANQLIRQAYNYLPAWIQLAAEASYRSYKTDGRATYSVSQVAPPPAEIEQTFVRTFFDSRSEYEEYSKEFDDSIPVQRYSEYEDIINAEKVVHERYEEPYEQHDRVYWAGIKMLEGRAIYTLLRKLQPSILVETGVANGWSTMCILAALESNSKGDLYSVDYQIKSDKRFDEYKQEHFFGDAEIPADKDTGWLVPDEFRHRWELRLGKSQRLLPELMTELQGIDYFHHDSEHSDPCMMFEYEMGWEFLNQDGIIVSDDMNPSLAWEVFSDTREPSSTGLISYPNQGYMMK